MVPHQGRSVTSPTPRRAMSAKRRHHIFTERSTRHHIAPCCVCEKDVHRLNDRWIVEHLRALGMLGPDTNANCGVAHFECAQEKTSKQDLPNIAKAKRRIERGMSSKSLAPRALYQPRA